MLWIGAIKLAKTQWVSYGIQGFENPMPFHVSYGRTDFVWSLARFSAIGIIINPLITLGDAFLPLVDLFISPVTILDVALACAASRMMALQASSLLEAEMSSNDTVPCDKVSSCHE